MLMPTLSVTAIGLLVAVVTSVLRGGLALATLAFGVVAAWAGFVAGAVVGVVLDVIVHTGVYVAVLGHLGAVTGAAVVTPVIAVPPPGRDGRRRGIARSGGGTPPKHPSRPRDR